MQEENKQEPLPNPEIVQPQPPISQLQPDTVTPTQNNNVATVPQPATQDITSTGSAVSNQANTAVVTDPQNSQVIYGHNVSENMQKSRILKMLPVISISFLVLVILGAVCCLFILPALWSNNYLKNIKTVYSQQSGQMASVYKSLNDPIFNDSATLTEANQELQDISNMLATASTNTKSLKSQNHLTVLPLTDWLHTVSSADHKYRLMSNYINDSNAFITDYSDLIVYLQQYQQIVVSQFPNLINQFDIINKGAQTSVFIVDLQSASSTISGLVSQLDKLKPSTDLTHYNQELITNLNSINSALTNQIGDLQSNNEQAFNDQKTIYNSAFQNLGQILNSKPLANFQTDSNIHSQITNLEKEDPLK